MSTVVALHAEASTRVYDAVAIRRENVTTKSVVVGVPFTEYELESLRAVVASLAPLLRCDQPVAIAKTTELVANGRVLGSTSGHA